MKSVSRILKSALLFVFAFHAASLCSRAAENMPVTHAETLAGQKLEFPAALQGKPAVCVFGFSKGAGDLTKVWMARLSQDGVNSWSVADLEKAPALVRGMIRGSMRKGTPQALLEHSLILTKDDEAWRRAVGVKQDSLPVVVLYDATSKILWTYEGAFGEGPLQELKARVAAAAK